MSLRGVRSLAYARDRLRNPVRLPRLRLAMTKKEAMCHQSRERVQSILFIDLVLYNELRLVVKGKADENR